MKYLIICFSFIFIVLSCGQNNDYQKGLLNTSKLNSQFAGIRTDRDTELMLQSGTRLIIPKGTLESKSELVTLEFKEALRIEQIIAAGLNTKSNGKTLSSGGMLYINVAEGEKASIAKPIKIKIPTPKQIKGMQLYKGDETEAGINWVKPQPINIPKDTQLEMGKALYSLCQSCHNTVDNGTGPALYESMYKYGVGGEGEALRNQFIRNSAKLIADGNPYATCIYEKWGKTAMVAFPNLTDAEIDAIYYYIRTDARERLGADTNRYLHYTVDSCMWKIEMLQELEYLAHINKSRKDFLAVNNLPDSTIKTLSNTSISNSITDNDSKPDDNKRYINPETNPSEYYNIEINTFGWFNIDILIEEINGVKQSELFVKLTGDYESKMQVMLIIPSHKVMVQGGLLDDGISFGFKETNGKLPLMQGVQAFILAIGENPNTDQLYIGTTSFITKESQTIEVKVDVTNSTQMKLRIDEMNFQNTTIKITRDTTQATPETLKKEIERLEEDIKKGCDCLRT